MDVLRILMICYLLLATSTVAVLGTPVPGNYSISASWQPFLYCNNQGNTMYASCSNGECYPVCSNEMAGVRINQTHAAIFGGYSSTLIDFVDKLWIWDSNRLRFVFETSNPNLTRTASTGWVSSDDGRFTIWGGSRGTDNGNMLSAAIATTPWSWQANPSGTTVQYTAEVSPGPRSHMAWWRYQGKTRIFSAFNSDFSGYKDVWEWSDVTQTWSKIGGVNGLLSAGSPSLVTSDSSGAFVFSPTALPRARNEPTYATAPGTSEFANRTYIFGGNTPSETVTNHFADFWAFDNEEKQWANFSSTARSNVQTLSPQVLGAFSPNNFPSARSYGVMWIDTMGYVWMFGGYDASASRNDLWLFSPYLNQWAKIYDEGVGSCIDAPLRPAPRAKAAFWNDEKFMYLYGGFAGSSCFGDTWRLNASVTLTSCPAGYEIRPGDHFCYPCIDGKFAGAQTGYQCRFCSDGQVSLDGISCSNCGDGQYRAGNMTSCQLCDLGTISNSTKCVACAPGAESNQGRTACIACTGVSYKNATMSVCANCSASSVPDSSKGFCVPCLDGQYRLEGMSSCENCTGISYRNASMLSCANCPEGSVPDEMRSNCVLCPLNFFRNSTLDKCLECPANTRNNRNYSACIPCLQNQIYDSILDRCNYCPDGFEAVGSSCTPCVGNTYSNSSSFGVCLICPASQVSTRSQCVASVTCTQTQCTFNCINNNNTCNIAAEVIEVRNNQTVDVTGTVTVAGNVSVTGGSTIRISSGSTLTVAECLTVSEGSTLQVIVSSAAQNGSIVASYDSRCSSVPPVAVSSTVDECQSGQATVRETQESATRARLELVFTPLPTDSGKCGAGNVQGGGMSTATIGIIAGCIAGAIVIAVLLIVFLVKPIRQKIFPYSARRNEDMKSNDKVNDNEEEMKPTEQKEQAPAEPQAAPVWRASRPSISSV